MKHELPCSCRRGVRLAGAVAMILGLAPLWAQATQLELVFNGAFNTLDALNPASQSSPTFFTATTPFTINAFFDTNSPNLAPPSPPAPPPFAGFRAYAPSVATITIAGTTYGIDTIANNPTAGITVAVFDNNSFTPGRYGVGILQQPPQDGAGIVADFTGASPNYSATNIGPTIYTGFYGVGYGSGVCLEGIPGACSVNAVTPLILHSGANTFALTLGNYSEDSPAVHDPTTGNLVGPLNSVSLVAVPEPGTLALGSASFLLLCTVARRKRAVKG